MASYRERRNIEASVIDYLQEKMEDAGWTGFRFEKAFSRAYKGNLPCVVINCDPVDLTKLEIGSKTNLKYYTLVIRLFCDDDGQRLDVADFLTDLLEDDIPYYKYTITNGQVSSKVLSGRIEIDDWINNDKELKNTENLEQRDKFRHILSVLIAIR